MGMANKIDSERIGTVSVSPILAFLYATINVIPLHTRVDGKSFHGDDKPRRTSATLQLQILDLDLKLELVGVVVRLGHAAPLVRPGEPVTKIKTTKINFGASF